MCFYNDDYDWCASIHEETEGNLDSRATCDECGRKIEPGEWRKHVYQQEHEECSVCEYEEPESGKPCEVHDYGETYDYDCCRICEWILESVEAVEKDEGCPEYARRPCMTELKQEMWNEREAGRRYLERAIKDHAELALEPWVVHFMEKTSQPVETWP